VPASLANSSGIFLGSDFRCDLVRPGIALYGGNPVQPQPNPMLPAVHLAAAILQLRDIERGEPVGYGATWTAERRSRIAVIAAGYKDGVPRALGSKSGRKQPEVSLAGHRCPIVGRISMDMLAIDVTAVPAHLCRRGVKAEIIGPAIAIDEVAERAGTISYELLTRLGQRFTRVYAGAEPASAESP
jgi:alanine racemase